MSVCSSGGTRSNQKKAWAAIHIESAGATVLNANLAAACRRRHDEMKLSHTSTTAAGAGPKRTASVMKKVSATEMLAGTDAILTVNDPVRTVISASSVHSSRCGVLANVTIEWAKTANPIATMRQTYVRSGPPVRRGGMRTSRSAPVESLDMPARMD